MSDHFTPKHLDFKISDSKRKAKIECCAYCCKNLPIEKKKGLCHKHYARYLKAKDPVYDRYNHFKNNALARPLKHIVGEKFTITLEEFRDFCQRTGYIIKKGMRGKNCTIDRTKNNFGYHIWNIQIKSNLANIKKYHTFDKFDKDYTPF